MRELELKIKSMKPSHLKEIVLIHQQAFPGFFMTLLGSYFLESYYATVLKYGKSICLVYEDSGRNICGFAVGFINPNEFYAMFKSNALVFFIPVLCGLFRRPYLVLRILNSVLRLKKIDLEICDVVSCELSSIGVSKKGLGIGKRLLYRFIDLGFASGAEEICLTTDSEDNEEVIRFYKAAGFVKSEFETRGSRKMIEFRLDKSEYERR